MKYLLIGDSHCYALGEQKRAWERCAFHGITSMIFNQQHPGPFVADVVVISLGGNDERFPDFRCNTKNELMLLRSRVTAKKVIWFNTINSDKVRELQINIAKEHGDLILDSRGFELFVDGLHLSNDGYLNAVNAIEMMSV